MGRNSFAECEREYNKREEMREIHRAELEAHRKLVKELEQQKKKEKSK